MFLDDAEQVFILNYDVWMRFRENRSTFGSVPHPIDHHSDALQSMIGLCNIFYRLLEQKLQQKKAMCQLTSSLH